MYIACYNLKTIWPCRCGGSHRQGQRSLVGPLPGYGPQTSQTTGAALSHRCCRFLERARGKNGLNP
jgi:hypothetical protein